MRQRLREFARFVFGHVIRCRENPTLPILRNDSFDSGVPAACAQARCCVVPYRLGIIPDKLSWLFCRLRPLRTGAIHDLRSSTDSNRALGVICSECCLSAGDGLASEASHSHRRRSRPSGWRRSARRSSTSGSGAAESQCTSRRGEASRSQRSEGGREEKGRPVTADHSTGETADTTEPRRIEEPQAGRGRQSEVQPQGATLAGRARLAGRDLAEESRLARAAQRLPQPRHAAELLDR